MHLPEQLEIELPLEALIGRMLSAKFNRPHIIPLPLETTLRYNLPSRVYCLCFPSGYILGRTVQVVCATYQDYQARFILEHFQGPSNATH